MDNFTVAMQNQLGFHKTSGKQIQQISFMPPHPSDGTPPKEPVQESVKSISTLFEEKATESSKESLKKVNEGSSKVYQTEGILLMSEVCSKAILSQLWNPLGEPEV